MYPICIGKYKSLNHKRFKSMHTIDKDNVMANYAKFDRPKL